MNTDAEPVARHGVRGEDETEMIPLNSLALSIYQVVLFGFCQQRVLGKRNVSHGVKSPLPACYPETVKRLRPLALLLLIMARPALVFIRLRKPCVRRRFMLLG